MRVDPRTGFGQVFRGRSAMAQPGEPPRDAPVGRQRLPDIEDVEAKPPRE
jgi:hypothetical protein